MAALALQFDMLEPEIYEPEMEYPVLFDGDAHLVVRETPAWKANARFDHVLNVRREMTLAHDLAWEQSNLPVEENAPQPEPGIWASWMEMLAVTFCRTLHVAPIYDGGNHSTCPSCNKKYAVPWADLSKIETNVYVQEDPALPATAPQKQAC